jgi:ABC-2 type transport system permease protein
MIFDAFYRSSSAPQPMTFEEVVNYVWLGQALFAMLPFSVDPEIRGKIRDGSVAYELVRPLDLYNFWFCRAVATRFAPTLLRSMPIFLVALLFLGLQLPASPAATGAWILATVGALLLSCAISNLINISLMWTIAGEGIVTLVAACLFVFSGMVVPLPLFPEWAMPLFDFLPFRGIVDLPFRLYMGHIPPEELFPVLRHQLLWIAALVILGRWLLARGTRRLVVQGG